jgi:hypothetical protein
MTKLLTITPGQVKVGEVTVEINGGALDALSLAEQFVQVFDTQSTAALLSEAMTAFRNGLRTEYLAISVAVNVWQEAEQAYAEAKGGK